jgi:RNA polymerase sigma factor (sigma-70 family)
MGQRRYSRRVVSHPGPRGRLDPARADRAGRLADSFARARAGDAGALDDVVGQLNPLLWHVARTQGLSRDEAMDVVQTTWLELLRRMEEIRDPHALTAWLVTTTRRQAVRTDARRRRRAGPDLDQMENRGDGRPDVSDLVDADERRRVLWRHVGRLSERCRALLRVVAFADRPDYAAIGDALGMPHGSIGPTRGRCLAKLRESLLADPEWSGP